MALEMKVYREIHGYEAKVMWGLSWRQLAALGVGVPITGGLFALVSFALHQTGRSWDASTNVALYVMFFALLPFAAWGWWRPKSLKPEQFIGYLIRHNFTRKVTPYVDTYELEPHERAGQPSPVPAEHWLGALERGFLGGDDGGAGAAGLGNAEPVGLGGAGSDGARRAAKRGGDRREARRARRSRKFVPTEHSRR